jgi:hypothetical protein
MMEWLKSMKASVKAFNKAKVHKYDRHRNGIVCGTKNHIRFSIYWQQVTCEHCLEKIHSYMQNKRLRREQ